MPQPQRGGMRLSPHSYTTANARQGVGASHLTTYFERVYLNNCLMFQADAGGFVFVAIFFTSSARSVGSCRTYPFIHFCITNQKSCHADGEYVCNTNLSYIVIQICIISPLKNINLYYKLNLDIIIIDILNNTLYIIHDDKRCFSSIPLWSVPFGGFFLFSKKILIKNFVI